MSNSRSAARNDLDNFSTNSGGTLSLDAGGLAAHGSNNGLNDDSQLSLASTASAPISTEDSHNHNHNHHTNNNHQTTGGPNSKYEKLVQDYVKLRSKLSILKKAYVELSESSAQKDQSLRKCEQEIEGLSFRNQQLTSRVEVLQRDLLEATNNLSATVTSTSISTTTTATSVASSSNLMKLSPSNSSLVSPNNNNNNHTSHHIAPTPNLPSSTSSSSSNLLLMPNHPSNHSFNYQPGALINSPDNRVIAEELEHKINENTVLHRRLNEVEMEFRQKLAKTEQSLKQVEYEKCLLEKKLESLETSSKQTIERLQNDKIKLELNLIQLENQLRETHQEKETLLLERTTSSEQQQKQESLNKNSSSSSLSSIPNHSSSSRLNEDSTAIMNCVRSSVEALNRAYSSLEERNTLLKPFLANGPKLAAKCEQALASIEQKFTSGKIEPAIIQGQFDEFLELNKKLIQATVAELGVSTSVSLAQSTSSAVLAKPSEDMDKLHKKLKIYLNKIDVFMFDTSNNKTPQNPDELPCFSQYLTRLLSYVINPPAQQPSPNRGGGGSSSQVTSSMLRTKIPAGLKNLADLIEKLLFAYNEKLSLEYTLDYATSVTTLDECLVSYFGQLKQSLGQLAALVSETSSNPLEILDLIRSELVVVPLVSSPLLVVVDVDAPTSSTTQQQHSPVNANAVVINTEEMEALREQLGKRESELKEISDSYEQLKESYESSVRLGDELKSRLEKLQTQYMDLDERHRRRLKSDEEKISLTSSNDGQQQQQQPTPPTVSNLDQVIDDEVKKPVVVVVDEATNIERKEDQEGRSSTSTSVIETLEFMVENVDLIDTYQKQIDTLNSRIEYLDSKTVYYHDEVRSLVERLRLQQESNRLAGLELDEVKDQLERTRSSYETQMSTMSDHLIEMTDRMSRHVEENEKLKLELVQARSASSSSNNNHSAAANKASSKSSSSTKKSK